jgi:hypothetical protein
MDNFVKSSLLPRVSLEDYNIISLSDAIQLMRKGKNIYCDYIKEHNPTLQVKHIQVSFETIFFIREIFAINYDMNVVWNYSVALIEVNIHFRHDQFKSDIVDDIIKNFVYDIKKYTDLSCYHIMRLIRHVRAMYVISEIIDIDYDALFIEALVNKNNCSELYDFLSDKISNAHLYTNYVSVDYKNRLTNYSHLNKLINNGLDISTLKIEENHLGYVLRDINVNNIKEFSNFPVHVDHYYSIILLTLRGDKLEEFMKTYNHKLVIRNEDNLSPYLNRTISIFEKYNVDISEALKYAVNEL